MRKWRITYLPMKSYPGEIEWVFQGSEYDLNKYLSSEHGCDCPDCEGGDWWESAQACEYEVEEILEDY